MDGDTANLGMAPAENSTSTDTMKTTLGVDEQTAAAPFIDRLTSFFKGDAHWLVYTLAAVVVLLLLVCCVKCCVSKCRRRRQSKRYVCAEMTDGVARGRMHNQSQRAGGGGAAGNSRRAKYFPEVDEEEEEEWEDEYFA